MCLLDNLEEQTYVTPSARAQFLILARVPIPGYFARSSYGLHSLVLPKARLFTKDIMILRPDHPPERARTHTHANKANKNGFLSRTDPLQIGQTS